MTPLVKFFHKSICYIYEANNVFMKCLKPSEIKALLTHEGYRETQSRHSETLLKPKVVLKPENIKIFPLHKILDKIYGPISHHQDGTEVAILI